MREITEMWPEFVKSFVAAVNLQWGSSTPIHFWSKCKDGTLVSDFDVKVDITVRQLFSQFYPGMPLLSEELGWLTSHGTAPNALSAIVDPVDGTESLANNSPHWWVSIAICTGQTPVVGLVYQPETQKIHDSMRPSRGLQETTGKIGMSADQLRRVQTVSKIQQAGFELITTPHAVDKVAAVIEGRCDASVYLPSEKSPDWRSWDLAACIPLARENGLVLLDSEGRSIVLDDFDARFRERWICARDRETFEAVRVAID